MRAIFLILCAAGILNLSAVGSFAESGTAPDPRRYSEKDVGLYENVLQTVREASLLKNDVPRDVWEAKLSGTADIISQIKNLELGAMAIYLVAADGYAPRGEMERAIVLMRDAIQMMKQSSGTQEEDAVISKPAAKIFAMHYEKSITDLVVAVAESRAAGNLDEKTARANIIRALAEIETVYYRLMGIEKAALRLPNRTEVERLFQELVYTDPSPDVLADGKIHTTYDLKGRHALAVSYEAEVNAGTKEIAFRVSSIHHIFLNDNERATFKEFR